MREIRNLRRDSYEINLVSHGYDSRPPKTRAEAEAEYAAAERLVQSEAYERRFDADWQEEAVAKWEQTGLCCVCLHAIADHGEGGCDWEVRDYGETDCGCTAYRPRHPE